MGFTLNSVSVGLQPWGPILWAAVLALSSALVSQMCHKAYMRHLESKKQHYLCHQKCHGHQHPKGEHQPAQGRTREAFLEGEEQKVGRDWQRPTWGFLSPHPLFSRHRFEKPHCKDWGFIWGKRTNVSFLQRDLKWLPLLRRIQAISAPLFLWTLGNIGLGYPRVSSIRHNTIYFQLNIHRIAVWGTEWVDLPFFH